MAKLYIIATPIGNMEDITLRALRVLGEVDLILCEDTRVSKKLLSHYKINTQTDSFHARSSLAKTKKVIDILRSGKNVALISDSGTPTISDPGGQLVSRVYEKLENDVEIVPVPGPSALIAALSVSGIPADQFLFLGFLPHKKGREKLFKEIADSKRTAVFYESPHRIMKTLASLVIHLEEERKIIIARELTKIYEEIVRGNSREVLEYFTHNTDKVRGEFVVLVAGSDFSRALEIKK